ncbi:MAG TPA: hydroxyacylglutathione hydrolase [Cellvibrionaceae bacterium]|nr:hydroxyacylglutathione hydrolase [Cellvibrionaceae bacterium]HNG61796.1 hydroxyacylglutathione hydrolase [Cellvibrionaceae bacterium]
MLNADFVIHPVPILTDNYVWILVHNQDAWIIDPGEAAPVAQFCHSHGLMPKAILLTHLHQDHWAGVAPLLEHYPVPVLGPGGMPASIARLIAHQLAAGDTVSMAERTWQVVALPGHTPEHIGFYLPGAPGHLSPGHLFSGDTLFSFGCGRAFYSVEQLFTSVNWIKNLPANTCIYPTHEYTAANWRFARAVEPDNPHILTFAERLPHISPANPSLPVVLADELNRNPFLRCGHKSVQKAAGLASGSSINCDLDVFSALRSWKNVF